VKNNDVVLFMKGVP